MNQKLTATDVEFIRLFGGGERPIAKPSALAQEYGVCTETIYDVLNGKSHKPGTAPRNDRRMSDDEVREIKRLQRKGLTDWKISRATGRSRSTIRQIMDGKTYRDVKI